MTDAAILAMFKPGTKWRIQTTDGTFSEIRTVIRVSDGCLNMTDKYGTIVVCTPPTGKFTKEARPGYVRANYNGNLIDAIFTLQDTQRTLLDDAS